MANTQITLSAARLQQIARYQITFKDILPGTSFDEINIVYPEVYSFSLDDLYRALHALKKADPTVSDFGEYWYYPITQLSGAFDLDRACGRPKEAELITNQSSDPSGERKHFPGLLITDGEYFHMLWQRLEDIWTMSPDDLPLSDALNFDTIISDFDRYLSNRGKPLAEWEFSIYEIEEFIGCFDEDEFIKIASESELDLGRIMIDKLCAEGNPGALRIKGYACYGGSRLYPCDWNISRDCFIALSEKTDNPQYANTLGYIYYYGRCNGGVPEYDKAFHYFGIAAANGLYEGMYKLADMFAHGYSCKESKRTACALYSMVYDDSITYFLKGDHANFADAALRMGNVYANGIGRNADTVSAYHYYLQAVYAARIRAEGSDFFGNATVVRKAQNALEETRKQLPEDFFKQSIDFTNPYYFEELAENFHRCELSRSVDEQGHPVLSAKRLVPRLGPSPDMILITIPQLNYCERTREFSYTLNDKAKIHFQGNKDRIRYDYCTWNPVENRYEFFYDDTSVAWVKADYYRFGT